ncbi:MAG: porin family protein [Flavobacteriales bacterium]
MNTTKRNFLTVITGGALLLCTVASSAQKGEIGIRVMPTFSSFDMQTSSGGTVKGEVTLGYGIGGLLAFNMTENVGIQAEVIYNSISQKYKEQDIERKVNLKYVNVPLLLSLNTGRTKMVNLNLVVGPQIGISVGSKIEISGTSPSDTTSAVLSVKKGDLGVAYGGGLDFSLNPQGTFRVGFGFRGVMGFFDISDNSRSLNTDSYYILDKARVRSYSGYLGLSFLF